VKSDIPADLLERAQARVDQHLEALRHESATLGPLDDSALVYDPALDSALDPGEAAE
jgi:hypothetical protein